MSNSLQRGIAALKTGDKAQARPLLIRATQENPQSEQAWLWLSGAVESDDERLVCLNEVLEINPNNEAAQRGVTMLRQKGIHQPTQTALPQVVNEPKSIRLPPLHPEPIMAQPQPSQDISSPLDNLSPQKQQALKSSSQLIALELSQGKSRKTIVKELTHQGFPQEAVKQLVDEIAQKLKPVYAKQYKKRMVRGLVWTIAGIAITFITFSIANERGSKFLVCYGAILFGFLDFFLGLVGWLSTLF